jgi:uncharacterized repeat protein (TIGR01451 family)
VHAQVFNPSINASPSTNGLVTYQLHNIGQNTHVFTLFGDGYFSTLQNPAHVFASNAVGYTTESYFAKAYDPNLPPKRTVTTGPIVNSTGNTSNPTVSMTGNIDVFTSWATAKNYENFYILAFKNTTSTRQDGCVAFLYNQTEISVDLSNIKIYNNWVYNQNHASIVSGSYSHEITWLFKNLQPNEVRYVYIPAETLALPSEDIHINVKYGKKCDRKATGNPHTFKSRKYPHDPNYKIVNKQCLKPGISEQQELIYTIGFYNDGQYFAHDVFVSDDINAGLDANSVTLVDYEVQPTISQSGNTLFFDFLGIDLPGTNQNTPKMYTYDQASTYFSFKICTYSNLASCIYNQASIVFDTQPVFYTNVSQICPDEDCYDYDICGDKSLKSIDFEAEVPSKTLEFSAFPKPATDVLTVNVNFNSSTISDFYISLLDFSGRIVRSIYIDSHQASIFNKTISLNDLASGLYFLTLATKEGKYTKKIVKN